MAECLSANSDPDPGGARAAATFAALVLGLLLGLVTTWVVGLAAGVSSCAIAVALISKYFRTRRISLFSDGFIELEQDGEVHRYAVAEIVRVWSTGDFSPGPRITIEFTNARQIPALDPGDSAKTLKLLGNQLVRIDKLDVVDKRARKYLIA